MMLSKLKLNQLYLRDTQFANLMTKRIFNVLLVANPYDAFMLEDDGRIEEKIFIEYMNLSLRYPPRFTQVSTIEEAWKQLEHTSFELVICMPGSDSNEPFDIARAIKEHYPHIPLVVLTLSFRTASVSAWNTKTSAFLNMCSAGWEIPTCWYPLSS